MKPSDVSFWIFCGIPLAAFIFAGVGCVIYLMIKGVKNETDRKN